MPEEQIAHAHPALAEPAQRALVEARVPVLVGDVGANAFAELGGDLVDRLAHGRERRPFDRARTRQERVDGGAKETAMTAGGGEDVDLPVVRPAAQRVRVDAQNPAGLAEGEPVAVLAGCGRSGNTVNLGETPFTRPMPPRSRRRSPLEPPRPRRVRAPRNRGAA